MAKIIVVDDEPSVCVCFKLALESKGHVVRTALVGDDAIDQCYLFEPEVLITDWKLQSEYDGLEVVAGCRAADKRIATILVSGYDVEGLSNFDDLKLTRILKKPFAMEVLFEAVEEALHSRVE